MRPETLYETLLRTAERPALKPPRPSASVVPWRRRDGALEVYWIRRSPELAFMGGWHAFPGGGLAKSDAALPLARGPRGGDGFTPPGPDAEDAATLGPDLVPGLVVAAIRELFEETGLLLADGVASSRLGETRRRLLAGEVSWGDLVAAEGWRLDAAPLVFAGRWLTPPFAPLRFDNRFFLLEHPVDREAQPTIVPGELAEGEWIAPAAALDRWREAAIVTAPPILHLLRVLADDGPEAGLPRLLDTREADLGPFRRVELRPGVVVLPLRTPTLPPATHTNAVLLGHRDLVLVDPGTPLADEQARLLAALQALEARGQRLAAIWLTHHHADHVGAVDAVRAAFRVPVLAHPATAERLAERGIAVDGALHDGERIVLDGAFPVRILHTPGHTRGHLAFFCEEHATLLCGDLASTLSTIVVDPPEGDMSAYLESLDRAIALAPRALFPAHGPVALDAVGTLERLRRHRLEREAAVRDAWERGLHDPATIVREVYADVDPAVHPIAARQVVAHLERLGLA